MKKVLTLTILFLGIFFSSYGQEKGFPNPAVAYIQKMGYNFDIRTDAKGNQYTVCVFPDGTEADAWAFMNGKAGQKFSYCEKKGYATENQTINHGTYSENFAVCTRTLKSGQKESVPMLQLMEKNGEPLIQTTERPVQENTEGIAPSADPNLKMGMDLPASFNWCDFTTFPQQGGNYSIGPIRDQGNCGSCYSFGACANAEGVYNVKNNLKGTSCKDFSEAFIMWCLGKLPQYNSHFYGCQGADYSFMELEAQITDGIITEADFPYTIKAPRTCAHWSDQRYSFNNWHAIPCSDVNAIKTAIYTYGPIDASVYVGSDFQNYTNGIFTDTYNGCNSTNCNLTPTNHSISLVGWGNENGQDYFILRNSWGASWGQGGYMKIDVNSARVACEAAYLTLDPNTCDDINGTQSNPAAIALNTEVQSQIKTAGEADWFTFTTSKTYPNLEVQIYAMPANYNIDLYSGTSLLASSKKDGTQPEKIIYNTKTAKTYKVKVYGNSASDYSPYCYTLLASSARSGFTTEPGMKAEFVEAAEETSVSIYPNPTTGKFSVDYNGTYNGKVSVTVYSISGQKLLSQDFECLEGSNTYNLDLGKYPQGMYLLELRDQNGSIFQKLSLE
ncbi:MAG: C1 family peptidase [Bacteroidota bacterium]|nr:C1 family peptidase [Bacteroidota bacterium]